jgi:hypothetical protein
MMSSINGDFVTVMYSIVVFGLIIIFITSFTLFIRRFLINSSKNGKKLDIIIELLKNDEKI